MLITSENYRTTDPGTKARNLFLLKEAGFSVPPFFCVDKDCLEEEILSYLAAHFPDTVSFSVRSCASLEDAADYSFAGQFRTFLHVPKQEVCLRIQEVLSDAEQPETLSYCNIHGLDTKALRMQVIVQEMIEADISGVLFTANPQGPLNESVIVYGAGCGNLIVEDKTDTTTCYYHLTDNVFYQEQTGASPLLEKTQIEELIVLSQHIKEMFATECDMEFAIKNRRLYFLQVRPVTTFRKNTPVIILDNSNIVESYPGITLPLTQSFIGDAYYQVFKSLLLHLTGEPESVETIDENLRHMVDVANGRIYYRISNWYDVLLFLPFARRLIPIWQEMMGVKEKAVSSSLQGRIRRHTRLKVALSFFRLLCTCPKEMKKLEQYFQDIIARFDSLDTDTTDNLVLLEHYHTLLDMTVRRWDMTLVNDMYSFLFTGLLKKRLKKQHIPDWELAANRAISGIGELESMRPVRELQKLAKQAKQEKLLLKLQSLQTNEACEAYLKGDSAFSRQLRAYIEDFGDRNVEELKLESKTFRTDPVLLIRCILQYAEMPDSVSEKTAAGDFITVSSSASEKPVPEFSSTPNTEPALPPLTGLSTFFAKRAALGIRNREKSRLSRARLYGMMRSLVLKMGENLYAQHKIARVEDIFWLYCEEIEAAGRNPSLNFKELIAERKEEYEGFRRLPAYSRLVFPGKIIHKHPRNDSRQNVSYKNNSTKYTGTACSSGCAEGEVLLVTEPSPLLDTKNKILVTKMTDPGWVFLIAPAKALISEKGSLLSHTAIIARELGKPAVVGIEHITEVLRNGDIVRVDGDNGMVTLLRPYKG